MKRVQIHLTEDQVKVLKHVAFCTDSTLSSLVRQAIDRFLGESLVLSQLYDIPEGDIRVIGGKLLVTPRGD